MTSNEANALLESAEAGLRLARLGVEGVVSLGRGVTLSFARSEVRGDGWRLFIGNATRSERFYYVKLHWREVAVVQLPVLLEALLDAAAAEIVRVEQACRDVDTLLAACEAAS